MTRRQSPGRPFTVHIQCAPPPVEVVKLVKEFQRERRLSLDEIAALFQEKQYDASALRRQLATRETAVPSSLFLRLSDVPARLSPPPAAEWLDEVVKARLVGLRYVNGQIAIEAEQLPLLQAIWDGTRQGMPLAEFERLRQEIEGSLHNWP